MIAPTEPAGKPAVLGVSAHLPERPRLAPGLRLAGQMRESAFVEPPWLLEREGAGYIQLTELLYRVVEQCTGQRSVEDIADQVSLATGRRVSADNVRYLLARCLLPRGLVLPANGATVPPGDRGRSWRSTCGRARARLSRGDDHASSKAAPTNRCDGRLQPSFRALTEEQLSVSRVISPNGRSFSMTPTRFASRRYWRVLALGTALAVFWLGGGDPALAAPAAVPALLDTSAAAPGPLDADPCASAAVQIGGGGANNMVLLHNQVNGGLTARGTVQVNQIPGPSVGPVNCAYATSTCLDCQTLAVALQINLISRTATFIAPRNVARAQNVGCQGCRTAALALQYVRQVDDPTSVPPEFASLAQRMNDQLRVLQTDPGLTLDQAVARIDAVLAQFQDLATSVDDQRDQALQ